MDNVLIIYPLKICHVDDSCKPEKGKTGVLSARCHHVQKITLNIKLLLLTMEFQRYP